jgi:16S rRNA (uracil1498-N3)-methyltransferase
VKPEGKNKLERWARIATESAKQSRRIGVMQINELRPVFDVVRGGLPAIYLSTAEDAKVFPDLLRTIPSSNELTLLIGPEGGWTEGELALFKSSGIVAAKLTSTVLRIETAAIAAAAIAMVLSS